MKKYILIFVFIPILGFSQNLPDYSKSDPDNIINSVDTTKISDDEALKGLSAAWNDLVKTLEKIKDTEPYKKIINSETYKGLEKDAKHLEKVVDKNVNKFLDKTETGKGLKKDLKK